MNIDSILLSVSDLRRFVEDLLQQSKVSESGPPFHIACFQFLAKQAQHTESALKLHPSNDVELVARTMLEGLASLLWMAQKPEERYRLWDSYRTVEMARILERHAVQGGEPSKRVMDKLDEDLREKCGAFLRPKQEPGFPMVWKKYSDKWQNQGFLSMLDDIKGENLYLNYMSLCNWVHWSPLGMSYKLIPGPEGSYYTKTRDAETQAQRMFMIFQGLYEMVSVSLDILARPEKLPDFQRELSTIYNAYLTRASKKKTPKAPNISES